EAERDERVASSVDELNGAWPPPEADAAAVDDVHARLAEIGLYYGPVFQGLELVWLRDERIFAEVSLPESHATRGNDHCVHPALLDAALHPSALIGLTADSSGEDGATGGGVRL